MSTDKYSDSSDVINNTNNANLGKVRNFLEGDNSELFIESVTNYPKVLTYNNGDFRAMISIATHGNIYKFLEHRADGNIPPEEDCSHKISMALRMLDKMYDNDKIKRISEDGLRNPKYKIQDLRREDVENLIDNINEIYG